MMKSGNETRLTSMVYLRGVRGHKCTPLWRLVMYFCVHNCTSPSNDHAAVACSNNNQTQLHTHVSVPYWSPDVWLALELLRDIQFGHLRDRKWAWQPPNFQLRFARQWLNQPPFLNFEIRHCFVYCSLTKKAPVSNIHLSPIIASISCKGR